MATRSRIEAVGANKSISFAGYLFVCASCARIATPLVMAAAPIGVNSGAERGL
jgi:hypothetical protein